MELINLSPTTLALVMIWTLPWKGWALWIAARQNSKIWFIILLIFNTIGILEILYIFIFSKKDSYFYTFLDKIRSKF